MNTAKSFSELLFAVTVSLGPAESERHPLYLS